MRILDNIKLYLEKMAKYKKNVKIKKNKNKKKV
jgi:hypothetical protein